MTHTHQFIHLETITRPKQNAVSFVGGVGGAVVACAECGEVRKVWADGAIEVIHEGHERSS